MHLVPPPVKVTYQGKPLTQRFYDAHPEIHGLYPSPDVFMQRLYLPLIEKMELTKEPQLLEISENKVKVNGQDIKL